MKQKSNIWIINLAFIFSIILHMYVIFFISDFNINFKEKKTKFSITLAPLGNLDSKPKESIKKEKRVLKEIPEKKKKKKKKSKTKKKIDLKKTLPSEKSIKKKKTEESAKGGNLKGIEGGESKQIINQYVTQIYKLIDSKKKYPRQSLIRKEEGVVLMEIVIRNDGKLMSVKSIKAKHQRLVDSSFDAVELAAPFPPFPDKIKRKKMNIQVPVIYKMR